MITIIVLLILAGVSISLVVGNNGVLTQSQNAVKVNREAKAKEEVLLAWESAETKYWTEWAKNSSKNKAECFTKEELSQYVKETGEIKSVTYVEGGDSSVIYKSKDQNEEYIFIIDTNGNINILNITLKDGDNIVNITKDNVGDYLGREVEYTPSEAVEGYTTSETYRIFYIDFNNKYGDGTGTIYLKADWSKNAGLNTYSDSDNTEGSKYLQLNPQWSSSGNTDLTNTNNNKLKMVGLLKPNYWQNLKDTQNFEQTDINYVVGAPSLEMYVDSYNTYLDKHSDLSANFQKLVCKFVEASGSGDYREAGYLIGLTDGTNETWNNSGHTIGGLFGQEIANGMYNPGFNKNFWLASPTTGHSWISFFIHGGSSNSSVDDNEYSYNAAYCPVVSIKPNAQLTLK